MGQQIPQQYLPLVTAYLAGKAKPKQEAEPTEPEPDLYADNAAPFEDREMRIPKTISKRGRGRKREE